MSGVEPFSMLRLKKANDDAARLSRDEELALRLKGVTSWHERAETNPGANAKAETAGKEGCVLPSPLPRAARPRAPHSRLLKRAPPAAWSGTSRPPPRSS